MGTLIRHAGLGPPPPVRTLSVTMIQPPFRTSLVPAVGTAPLLEPGRGSAGWAAIALPTIAMLANPEHCVTFPAAADPLP